jgi:hypothetical protein
MKRKFITQNLTWSGLFSLYPWIFLAGALLLAVGHTPWMLLLLLAVLLAVIARMIINDRWLKQRQVAIRDMVAARHEYTMLTEGVESAPWFLDTLGAIDELHMVRDPVVTNVIGTSDWTYGDFTYQTYGKNKNSEYVQTKVYYGVMTTQLPRRLPHVFFDSIKARRRQFRFHFAADQRHSLEGDFDKFFVTYFPDGYTIDGMSIISPDVMLKLRDAREYDIEIFGNRLFLYGPLYEPQVQIEDMATKILAIKKELLDNVLTYRDDRLPYALGRKQVAAQGASLKISNYWKVAGWISLAVYIILRIAIANVTD